MLCENAVVKTYTPSGLVRSSQSRAMRKVVCAEHSDEMEAASRMGELLDLSWQRDLGNAVF